MAKVSLGTVANLLGNPNSAANTINNNSTLIIAAFENTLSRDGTTPNQMLSDIDMNNNDILNIKSIDADSLTIDGLDIIEVVTGLRDETEDFRDQAGAFANQSAASAASSAGSAQSSQSAAETAQDLVEEATSGFIGYQNGMAYDFGFITDDTTYFDFDWGLITDPVV